jgi:hypothetical protein
LKSTARLQRQCLSQASRADHLPDLADLMHGIGGAVRLTCLCGGTQLRETSLATLILPTSANYVPIGSVNRVSVIGIYQKRTLAEFASDRVSVFA